MWWKGWRTEVVEKVEGRADGRQADRGVEWREKEYTTVHTAMVLQTVRDWTGHNYGVATH